MVIQTLPENKSCVWRRLGIIQGIATMVLAATLLVGWYPTARAAGSAGVLAMLTAGGITWVAFCVSMACALLWRGSDPDPRQAGQAMLAARRSRGELLRQRCLRLRRVVQRRRRGPA